MYRIRLEQNGIEIANAIWRRIFYKVMSPYLMNNEKSLLLYCKQSADEIFLNKMQGYLTLQNLPCLKQSYITHIDNKNLIQDNLEVNMNGIGNNQNNNNQKHVVVDDDDDNNNRNKKRNNRKKKKNNKKKKIPKK